MQEVIGNVEGLFFDVDYALDSQLGSQPLPFLNMDKSGAAICVYYLNSTCQRGALCPFRHVTGEKAVVCKHWLRGLCKKGDQCEFLHEYDLSKMPECYFFSKYNACSNKECPFRHIDPESKIKDCAWYDRGFCRNGPTCKNRHRRRVMCMGYLNGFCCEGPKCKHSHPRFELPQVENVKQGFRTIVCHHCGEIGHKITFCRKLPPEQRITVTKPASESLPQPNPADEASAAPSTPSQKPLNEVTCYKCGEKGHYANKCSKGHLAFLSQSAHLTQEIRRQEERRLLLQANRRAGEMQR